ncbi:hypothetical protein [Ralstonia phage RpT1]|nr:hypothetical protein [Ralstonia phage RpT1]
MSRPQRVRINGRRWTLEYPEAIDDEGTYGITYYDSHLIQVRSGLAPIEEADTVIHEVLHALIASMGLTVPDEEPIVRALASGLTGVLADNPTLLKHLTGCLKGSNKEK